jgi:hypothetical protein
MWDLHRLFTWRRSYAISGRPSNYPPPTPSLQNRSSGDIFEGLHIPSDARSAAWLSGRFALDFTVRTAAPTGFEEYGRLFHPIRTPLSDRMLRWSEVARQNGHIPSGTMQFTDISTPEDEASHQLGILRPSMVPTVEQMRFLVRHLRRWTATPEICWFGLWSGFADLSRFEEGSPRFSPMSYREYLRFSGVIDAWQSFQPRHVPTIWWPDDKAWCVSTDIDMTWTYIAAQQICIEDLLEESQLEVYKVALNDPMSTN